MWTSLINTHASARMATQGKHARMISMSAALPLPMSHFALTAPPASMVRVPTLHVGESIHIRNSEITIH